MCHLSWDFYCYNDDGLEPGCIVASWGAQTRFAISCSSAAKCQFLSRANMEVAAVFE